MLGLIDLVASEMGKARSAWPWRQREIHGEEIILMIDQFSDRGLPLKPADFY
ncbi:hypothetical protein L288_18310 [Sphingobium quisquiliarum P25]|uniref:Uncharacterized protein n=1 Tax=Sphingobium quisquiliarum P25 TaxID=1329909 RepID=T0G9K2_9SPHN|nr:hypothetical protein L288_18310 [Sphingobium quisquiliarum P25]